MASMADGSAAAGSHRVALSRCAKKGPSRYEQIDFTRPVEERGSTSLHLAPTDADPSSSGPSGPGPGPRCRLATLTLCKNPMATLVFAGVSALTAAAVAAAPTALAICTVVGATSLILYLVPLAIYGLCLRQQDLRRKYNAEWGTTTRRTLGAGPGRHARLLRLTLHMRRARHSGRDGRELGDRGVDHTQAGRSRRQRGHRRAGRPRLRHLLRRHPRRVPARALH